MTSRAGGLDRGRGDGGHFAIVSPVSRMIRTLVTGLLGIIPACSGVSSPMEAGLASMGDEGGSSMDAGVGSMDNTCSPTPKLLVDYTPIVEVELAADVAEATVQVNDTHLYFSLNLGYPSSTTFPVDAHIMRIPLGGGRAERVGYIPGGVYGSQPFVLTKDAVIAGQRSQETETADGGGAVLSFPLDGGDPTVLAPAKAPAAVIADDENAYFVDTEGTKSVPLAGGAVRMLAPGLPRSLALIGDTLFMAAPNYMAANGGTISSVPAAGGDVTVLAEGQGRSSLVIPCGAELCWLATSDSSSVGPSDSSLFQMPASGGTPKVLARDIYGPRALVFAGKNFFVTSGSIRLDILRVPAAGGDPVLVRRDLGAGLTLDDECLYWSDRIGVWSMSLAAAGVANEGAGVEAVPVAGSNG